MMQALLDPIHLLTTFGYIGLAVILFAESGLLIGFFLPGDSLLFAAGVVVAAGHLNLFVVLIIALIAAVLGDSFGYYFGKVAGEKLFYRKNSRLFSQDNVTRAHRFFDKYGAQSIILARFVPIIRTFTPIVAGVSSMSYKTFLTYNIIGGLLWTVGVTLLGVQLGKVIPNIDQYLLPIVGLVVVGSLVGGMIHIVWPRKEK